MSAFYALAYADRVELLTDGAIYQPDGTLTDIRSKVWASHHVPMAVTGRGPSVVVETMARLVVTLAAGGTFDGAMDRLAEVVAGRRDQECPQHFEMAIVGMSGAHGPCVYYFASKDAYGAFEPWTLYRIPDGELGAGAELSGEDMANIGDASDGLLGAAVPLFEAMRKQKGPNPTDPAAPHVHGIGGHLDWTVVDASGVATVRLHDWPDVVGEKIRPAGVVPGGAEMAVAA